MKFLFLEILKQHVTDMLLPTATRSEKKDTPKVFFSPDSTPIINLPVVKGVHFGKKDTIKVYFTNEPAPLNYIPVVKGVHKGKVCTFLCKTKKRVKVLVEGVGVRYLKKSSLDHVPKC